MQPTEDTYARILAKRFPSLVAEPVKRLPARVRCARAARVLTAWVWLERGFWVALASLVVDIWKD